MAKPSGPGLQLPSRRFRAGKGDTPSRRIPYTKPSYRVDATVWDADDELREKKKQARLMEIMAEDKSTADDEDPWLQRRANDVPGIMRGLGELLLHVPNMHAQRKAGEVREAGGSFLEQMMTRFADDIKIVQPILDGLDTALSPPSEVVAALGTPPIGVREERADEITEIRMARLAEKEGWTPTERAVDKDLRDRQTGANLRQLEAARIQADISLQMAGKLLTGEGDRSDLWFGLRDRFRDRSMAEQLVWGFLTELPLFAVGPGLVTKPYRAVKFAAERAAFQRAAAAAAAPEFRLGLEAPGVAAKLTARGDKIVEGTARWLPDEASAFVSKVPKDMQPAAERLLKHIEATRTPKATGRPIKGKFRGFGGAQDIVGPGGGRLRTVDELRKAGRTSTTKAR